MKLFVAFFAIVAIVAAGEAPSSDYLPPVEASSIAVEQAAFAPQESAAFADDGYRYKAVRRLKYRHRRDVNELPSNDYLPPAQSAPVAVEQVYSAPQESVQQVSYAPQESVQQVSYAPQESAVLANDGYRYKTVRRLKYRHRRDVNELPSNDYLPPAQSATVAVEQVYAAPQESVQQVSYAPQESAQQVSYAPQESAVLANDGYRYKTVRRLKYRHRRDVNELPSNDYLPPAQSAPVAVEQVYAAPQESVQQVSYAPQESVQQVSYAPQESAVLANDGYRYKTVRRLKYRHRRDVNELPSNDYLPPAQSAPVAVEQVYAAPQESVQQVSYAPQESVQQVSYAPQESAVLANDGYRYKTVRRLKYRHRRDVNELPSNDYLPPAQSAPVVVEQVYAAPQESVQQVSYAPQESVQQVSYAPQESAVLANDGYRYKTVRRLKYRHRRDVNELPSNDYLPPAQSAPVAVEQVYAAPQESVQQVSYAPQESVQQVSYAPQESAVLANDGYRYKTVRRLKYRHRRDVNELPSNDYLPPAQSAPVAVEQVYAAPQESVQQVSYAPQQSVQQVSYAPQESAVLANDGYRYKTVRRLKYRHRRDVNELPSNDYLPPAQSAPVAVQQVAYAPEQSVQQVSYAPQESVQQVSYSPQESAVLADDGYRYKAVRRLKYRQRRV